MFDQAFIVIEFLIVAEVRDTNNTIYTDIKLNNLVLTASRNDPIAFELLYPQKIARK